MKHVTVKIERVDAEQPHEPAKHDQRRDHGEDRKRDDFRRAPEPVTQEPAADRFDDQIHLHERNTALDYDVEPTTPATR